MLCDPASFTIVVFVCCRLRYYAQIAAFLRTSVAQATFGQSLRI